MKENPDLRMVFIALDRELSTRHSIAEYRFSTGMPLITQGVGVKRVYLISRGVMKLSFVNRSGREFILGLRSAPFLLGASNAILDSPSLVTAIALTPCSARQLAAMHFRRLLRSSPELAYDVTHFLALESSRLTLEMMEANSRGTRSRLIKLLRQLDVSIRATSVPNVGLLKNHEIAKMLAITPEHLSRLLHALQCEGLLLRDKRRIIIRDQTKEQSSAGIGK